MMANLSGLITYAGQQGQQTMYMIMMFAIIGFLFYVILVRPQKREQQERKRMLDAVKKGDRVITIGGMHGVVIDVDQEKNRVVIELAKNVRVTFSRTAVSSIVEKDKG